MLSILRLCRCVCLFDRWLGAVAASCKRKASSVVFFLFQNNVLQTFSFRILFWKILQYFFSLAFISTTAAWWSFRLCSQNVDDQHRGHLAILQVRELQNGGRRQEERSAHSNKQGIRKSLFFPVTLLYILRHPYDFCTLVFSWVPDSNYGTVRSSQS